MEYIDVLDEAGTPTGVSKSHWEIHESGDWHRAVHVWVLNSKKEFLIQKRAHQKANFPDLWDASVGGHVSAGQTAIVAAVRETQEELGLKISPADLEYISTAREEATFDYKGRTYFENSLLDLYLVRKDVEIAELKMEESEVADLKWISARDLEKAIIGKDKDFVPKPDGYAEKLISGI